MFANLWNNKRVESDSLCRCFASPPLAAHARRYVKEVIITFDIINEMQYYLINDKKLCLQRNRENIQSSNITQTSTGYTKNCPKKT